MKKAIAILLALLLCLTIGACGSGKSNKLSVEEMVEQASAVTLKDILYELENNEVRAEELYDGKLVIFENIIVSNIYSSNGDFASVFADDGEEYGYSLSLDIELPKDVAVDLKEGDVITVVGTLKLNGWYMAADLIDAHLVP